MPNLIAEGSIPFVRFCFFTYIVETVSGARWAPNTSDGSSIYLLGVDLSGKIPHVYDVAHVSG